MSRVDILGASLPEPQKELIAYREAVVADLAAQVSKLGQFLAKSVETTTEHVQSLTTKLEARFIERQADLDKQIDADKQKLKKERELFETARKEFDDRQRTHVRRDLLTKIQKNLEDRAKAAPLSEQNVGSRTLIHGFCWTILGLSHIGIIGVGYQLHAALTQSTFEWRIITPFGFCVALFVATLIFYLRWTSAWADRLAHNEQAVQQYASDILRASWIAELMFEYKDDKEQALSPELLASLSEGLFKREPLKNPKYHPTDDAFSILKRITAFEAGHGIVKLEATKPK